MKKIFLITALVLSAVNYCSAQNYSDNLSKNCIVYNDAQLIINNASSGYTTDLQMSEYTEDTDGQLLTVEMSAIYEWGHGDIPLSKVANDIWRLVSKQLQGEPGLLNLTTGNFIPTRNERGEAIFAFIVWNRVKGKWAIIVRPLLRIKTLYKGARMFA